MKTNNFTLRRWVRKLPVVLFATLFAAFILVPIMWMFATSLRHPQQAFSFPPHIIPVEFNLYNYKMVFEKVNFLDFIWNSFFVAFAATALQVLSSSMAAFAFSRLNFPGKNVLFMAYLATMMIPGAVMGIPRFIIMAKVGLVDHLAALILPAMFSAMGVFLIRQHMMGIPRNYDEAAYIDGANRFYCFTRIIAPMAKPAMMVIAVQTFIGNWNDFYGPLIYINSESKMTLPLGLTALNGRLGSGNRAAVLAGVLLSLIPPLIFYIFAQRYLIEGITLGGIKG